nr:helix-turn-helix transcriptional regulator [uncultured Butyrivibrio sp.]
MTVGERIKKRRLELGLTQEELAKRLGYGKSAVCRLEKSANNITTDRISKCATALETTPAYLMGWTDLEGNEIPCSYIENDEELLTLFHSFNEEGQKRLLEYARDLSNIEGYLKN